MNRVASSIMVMAAVVAAAAGGYWAAQHGVSVPVPTIANQPAPVPVGSIIYYQDPDGKPEYSAEPKQAADGRPYVAVRAEPETDEKPAARTAKRIPPESGEGQVCHPVS